MQDSQHRRLTRGRDRMLGGVASGLGDYFEVDPTVVRLLLVLGAVLSGGLVLVAYIALWVIMPDNGAQRIEDSAAFAAGAGDAAPERNTSVLVGIALISIGGVLLLNQFALFNWLGFGLARIWWPALLILAGAALIAARRD